MYKSLAHLPAFFAEASKLWVETNSIRHLDENVITGLLTVLMINVLELIGVNQANSEHASTGVRTCCSLDDLVKKRLAGQSAGQRVELKVSRISDFGQVARQRS